MFEPTILFGMFACLLGVAAAWHYGSIDLFTGVLAIIGVGLAQMSVNLIDDYEDYSSGLDKDTVKTKFSGGSEIVVKKLVKAKHALAIGIVAFVFAGAIGFYLISTNVLLLPLAVIGGLTVLLYAKFLSKIPYFSEPLTALNFALIPLGGFIAAGGSIGNIGFFAFAAAAVGLQVGITVIVNYMPDRIPDLKHGRRNIVAMRPDNKATQSLYIGFEMVSFLLILVGVALKVIPFASLLVLTTLPLVVAVSDAIPKYKNPKSFEWVMAKGATAELAFILLLIFAFVL